MFRLLDKLIDAGIDEVTVSNMNLLHMVRSRYPDLHITISIFQKTESLSALKNWKNWGFGI